MSIPRSGVKRPTWIAAGSKQLAVLVRDCSPSMSGQKAMDASEASRDLALELAKPENRGGFELAVVDFSNAASLTQDIAAASSLASSLCPIPIHGTSTNLTAGLQQALEVVRLAEETESSLRPVAVAFTDGLHNTGAHPGGVANELQEAADLVTVAFGANADEELLKEIASTPQHFYRCRDGAELRMFFAEVGRTLSASLQRGQAATKDLAQIQLK